MSTFRAIVVLCEGRTDVAYFRRLLNMEDYKDYKEVVGNMVKPLDSFFNSYLKSYNYETERVLSRPLLPVILRRNDGQKNDFALLYSMDGMNKVSNYRYVIDKYKKLINSSQSDFGGGEDLPEMKISFAFVFDMDQSTLADRIELAKVNFSGNIDELKYLTIDKAITNTNKISAVGVHVIKSPNEEVGSLEDILLSIIGDNNNITAAKEFLDERGFIRDSDDKTNSDYKKSLISIVGQLEFSGVDNSTIISKSSLFAKDLKSETEGRRFLEFINILQKTIY